MKTTLAYDLPDESYDFLCATNAIQIAGTLQDMCHWLAQHTKIGRALEPETVHGRLLQYAKQRGVEATLLNVITEAGD